MGGLLQDAKQAFKSLSRRPGLAATGIGTLALGIGAASALFSIVYGVLVRPLPYPEPDRLVRVSEVHPGGNAPISAALLSTLTYAAWSGSSKTLEGLAEHSSDSYTLTLGGESSRVPGASVSPSLFPLLRVSPALGRFFEPDDAKPGAAAVVVISSSFWRDRFGSDPGAVGKSLLLDGTPSTIVGVAPAEFAFPDREAFLYTPFVPADDGFDVVSVIARLAPGASLAQAAAEGTAAARRQTRGLLADLVFGKGGPVEVRVAGVADEMTSRVRPALLVLAVGVGTLLLAACANVANLLLSHGVARQRELAVRAALGAGPGRLVRLLLTESLLVASAGGALGLLLGWSFIRVLPALAPASFPRLDAVELDARVVGFGLLASLVCGLVAGAVPAMRGGRMALRAPTKDGDLGATSRRGGLLSNGLLAAEAALAVVLLVFGGLLARSFLSLMSVDGGYEPKNVLTARLYLPPGLPEGRVTTFVDAVVERLRALPGVLAAGAGNMTPLDRMTAICGGPSVPSGSESAAPVTIRALCYSITPGYAESLGLRLREGRFLADGDRGRDPRPVVVNDDFVHSFLASDRPVLGRRLQGLLGNGGTEVVGVVGNVLKDGLDRHSQPEVYGLAGASYQGEYHAFASEFTVVVRTSGNPRALAGSLRGLVHEIDPNVAIDRVGALSERVSASLGEPRFSTGAMLAFAGLALALAMSGLFAVLSHDVARRRREMGVRAALGAQRSDLVRLVLRHGLSVTVAGLGAGLLVAAGLTRLMRSVLFGVGPLDGLSFAGVPLLLLPIATAACLLPAYRASKADPSESLRCE
jgi:predicted permease